MTTLENNGNTFRTVALPKFTNPNIEQFHYVYKEKEMIYGHVVWHVGDGIYMFQEPIELKGNREAICAELASQYPDLVFYEFGDRYSQYKKRKKECILFVVSGMNRIICNYAELDCVKKKLDAAGNYAGPAVVEFLWNKFGSQNQGDFRIACHRCIGRGGWFGFTWEEEDEAIEADSGLLRFEFAPESMEECDGYKKNFLLGGSVGVMIDEGIYCFSPPDEESMVSVDEWHFDPAAYLPADAWLKYFPYGKQTISDFEGTVGVLRDCCKPDGSRFPMAKYGIRYLALGDEAAMKLRKLGKNLGQYDFRIFQRKKNGARYEWKDITHSDESWWIALINELEEDSQPETSKQPIEEDAVELVEGVGMTGLTIILKLVFQPECLKCRFEYAYALKDCIVLGMKERIDGNEIEKYIVPICIISELYVIVKMNLFDVITEKFSVPVIKNEQIEGLFMPEEIYQHYAKMSKTLSLIGKKWTINMD